MPSVSHGSHPPPESGGTPLSRVVLELRESISLRTEEGLFFGELARFGGGRMEVESEGRYVLRSEVEFQLKLPGFNSTVYGVARVLRVISRTAFLSQITLRILRMRDKERLLLQQFVAYSAKGRSQEQSDRSSDVGSPADNPWGIRPIDAEQQTRAGQQAQRDALRHRFDPAAGPRSRSDSSQGVRVPVTPFSPRAPSAPSSAPSRSGAPPSRGPSVPSRAGSSAPRGVPARSVSGPSAAPSSRGGPSPAQVQPVTARTAMGETIERHSQDRSGRRRGEPELSDHDGRAAPKPPPRPSTAQRREIRAEPRPAPTPTHARAPRLPNAADPQISLRLAAIPPQVFVRYSSRATFLSDYQAFLCRDLLFLKYVQAPPAQGSALSINMLLPSGMGLTIEATVNSVLSNGFGLSLTLDREAKALLATSCRV